MIREAQISTAFFLEAPALEDVRLPARPSTWRRSAPRCTTPLIKAFYQHLRDKGKPAKVALAAVIRELLIDSRFKRIKDYRAIATRYDKLATMFLSGGLATLLAVSLNGIVNTPLIEGIGHPEPVVVISQRSEDALS